MVSQKTLKQLKDISVRQRLLFGFHNESRFVCVEKTNHKQDILRKRFYVSIITNFYAVGTFGGFDKYGFFKLIIEDVNSINNVPGTHYITAGIEEVFEIKKKHMKHLHAGLE